MLRPAPLSLAAAGCSVGPGDRRPVGGAPLSAFEVREGVLENLYRTSRYARVTERRLGRTRTAGRLAGPDHRQNLPDRHATAGGTGVAVGPDSPAYVVQPLR